MRQEQQKQQQHRPGVISGNGAAGQPMGLTQISRTFRRERDVVTSASGRHNRCFYSLVLDLYARSSAGSAASMNSNRRIEDTVLLAIRERLLVDWLQFKAVLYTASCFH